ncbi:hypothetical protein AX16_002699 [Volvariella volvacea WC 439]|nr:hypothetical protein AX16_002699 [Volvariella volvacea WC 439]
MNPSPAHRLLLQHYDRLHKLGSYLSEMLQCDRDYILHDSDDEGYKVLLNALVAPNLESGQPHPKFEISPPMTDMREVIERAQERLFKGKGRARLTNIITLGYRLAQPGDVGSWGMSGIGITKQFENTIITALRAPEWETLLQRIGIDAMMHILTQTSTFVHLPNGCLCQVTGDQLLFRRPLKAAPDHEKELPSSIPRKRRIVPKTNTGPPQKRARTGYRQAKSGTVGAQPPAEISFDRSRLFYARPSYAPHTRRIVVGLPAQHILNTIFPSYAKNKPDDIDPLGDEKLVKQREHGVRLLAQNIFMKQYKLDKNLPGVPRPKSLKTPKRLKDILPHLDRLLYKHSKCAYKPLRDKVKAQDSKNLDSSAILEMMSEQSILLTQQPTASGNTTMVSDGPSIHLENSFRGKPRFIEFACSYNEVLRYVMVVTNAVIPKVFWGSKQNFKYIMERVKELISCRRFETLSLHDILQGFSTTACDWLIPPGPGASKQIRVSVSDFLKRRELLEEFLYWYFTSFVMPLLKTTFYITESSAFRNRVLYFRQDDWEILCAPLIERLSQKTFEKMEEVDAKEVLRQRTLGFSFVRLLPKDTGVRPIVNLKRKANNPMAYGPTGRSINQILLGAFQVLTYEKQMRPQLLGASVFSSDEIYSRLRKFKERLPRNTHGKLPKLYFVKMDVQACFDTIEQGKLLQIIKDLISQDTYMLRRHGQIVTSADRVKRIYVRKAVPEGMHCSTRYLLSNYLSSDDHCHFLRYATELAAVLRNVIFVDQVVYPPALKHNILHLLEEHITENIIDGTYYRQMVGIPQGSVLSALLCAFFYGDLEKQFGTFMDDPESVLLRLIDDYLFVTTSLSKAKQFLDMMSKGDDANPSSVGG